MKIFISADMEGTAGVTDWDQVMPDRPDYARFRRLMTEEVNAAVLGALEAGGGHPSVTPTSLCLINAE